MEPVIVEKVYAAKGDSVAADGLIREYLPFIKSETAKVTGGRRSSGSDDELSIAMIGFHEAIETYSRLRGAFFKYASVVMRRKLIDYYRKERRHQGQISLDAPAENGDEPAGLIQIGEPRNQYTEIEERSATIQEIAELSEQMKAFGLTLTDIADNCPKQARTLDACQKVLQSMRDDPLLIQETIENKRLPVTQLSLKSGVEKKTIERHRKYIMALVIIYSNGYEIIRGHLKQLKRLGKGGDGG